MAVNTVIQGTEADLVKKAMLEVEQAHGRCRVPGRSMLLQVHDELVFEVPPAESDTLTALVRDRMENVHALEVPLTVEAHTGANWRDAH